MDSLEFLATSLLGFLAVLCIYYIVWKKPSNATKKPPQPAGAWPIIGHLHLLARGDLPHKTLGAMADKYGSIFMICLGVRQAVVVTDPEIVKECFTINDKFLANRQGGVGAKTMGYDYVMFGFAPYGSYWRDMRKIIMTEVLSNRRIESLGHVWQSEICTSITELYKQSVNQNKIPVLVDIKQWFSDMTLNISLRMIVGKRYFGAGAVCEEAEARKCQKTMRNFFILAGIFVPSDYLPFLGWLDLGGYEKEMKITATDLDSLLQGWLDEHKRNRQSGRGSKGDQDFMDVMLSILEESKFPGYDIDTINKSACFGMVLGAADTTGVTLIWALSLLLNNPHVLQKAQDELNFHVGKDRQVNESDLKKLTYLDAILKETFRLYPAGPLLGPREVIEDCTIAGYKVRAGTRVIVNAWKMQRDPRIWSNPCEFQPDRFLDLDKDVDIKGQHYEFIPFGSGRRSCPGISFALQVLPFALARLLHGFDLKTPSGTKVDMTESAGLVVAKATPLKVLVTPRMSPKFYV